MQHTRKVPEEQESDTETIAIHEHRNNRKHMLIGILSFVVVCFGVLAIFPKTSQPVQNLKETVKSAIVPPSATPEPTPFQFQELTIPSLRDKSYSSTLNELQEVSSNDSYTAYVTSYVSDGLKINGLLTKPTGESPKDGWPAIVFVHGYIPPQTYRTTEKYVDYINYLARNGFVVLKIVCLCLITLVCLNWGVQHHCGPDNRFPLY